MFLLTSMPVGGAETLLENLVRRLDRSRFLPELCCLKTLGPLGEQLAAEIPAVSGMLAGKYDLRVLQRLTAVLRQRRVDALVTVGAGDKMFWGRLAAWRARVPVVISALHSTGWPDGIGRLNRALTPLTDAFVAVAQAHGQHLIQIEGFPADKVRVIPNGVDVARFAQPHDRAAIRQSLGLPADAPVAGIVAALRPEKDHALFLEVAARVRQRVADARFLIVGDGPERATLETIAAQRKLTDAVHFLGTRADIPQLLAALDVFVLTSRMEANPVSILEAMAAGKPVVAPRVGSIAESVEEGATGFLTAQGNAAEAADRVASLLADRSLAERMGRAGQARVRARWSLEAMVEGYEALIAEIYRRKCERRRAAHAGQPLALPGVLQPGRGNP
jgi:glycosyltransferase involved in cell wall biosynthesis